MKKLNLHDMYLWGKKLAPLNDLNAEQTIKSQAYNLFSARSALKEAINTESPLLVASRRAATELLQEIDSVAPFNFSEAMGSDSPIGYAAYGIALKLSALESVLANEMPGCSTYIALQKGIFQTEALIERAEQHFPPEIANDLPEQARNDLREAGKALAFELPTACSFHLWRAVETVTADYYAALTNSTFDADKVTRNWGKKIEALEASGADKSITQFLTHIKDQYRNPHTHPDRMVPLAEAQMLFGTASSAIIAPVSATQKLVGASGSLPLVQPQP